MTYCVDIVDLTLATFSTTNEHRLLAEVEDLLRVYDSTL